MSDSPENLGSASGEAAASNEDFAHALKKRRDQDKGRASSMGLVLVAALVALGGGMTALALFGLKDGGMYVKPIDEIVNNQAKYGGRPVRTEGNLVHGSLVKRESPCEYRFEIEKNGVKVPVRFPQCVVPDTFRDVPGMDVGVTVEGELRNGSFDATTVLAKCPSKYEMKQRQANGEQMPHVAGASGI